MPAPWKFDEETRARAVRLYEDQRRDHETVESKLTSRKEVGKLLDINPAMPAEERPCLVSLEVAALVLRGANFTGTREPVCLPLLAPEVPAPSPVRS